VCVCMYVYIYIYIYIYIYVCVCVCVCQLMIDGMCHFYLKKCYSFYLMIKARIMNMS